MTTFRVWAPTATEVDVEINGAPVAMAAAGGGWHEVTVEGIDAGADYAFALDGGPPRPDPRSPWQPSGVDGPSRTVDHDAFAWSDRRWRGFHLPSAVVYELHVGTFTSEGTFEAAIGRLHELVDLGVDAVELMPVAEFSGDRGWGYDGVDLYAPHHGYGGPDGLKLLVDACHARGIGVILDVVYNHFGPAGNYLAEFGSYFTDRYATPWGGAVNLDGPGSDEVRRFFVDNALMWLRDYHADGLRIDAVHAIVDMSATHFLEQLCREVEALSVEVGRPLWVVAESDLNDPRVLVEYGCHAQWSDDFHHALHAALTGERDGYYADFGSLSDVVAALTRGYVYGGRRSSFRDRVHGRALPPDVPPWRLFGFMQNHDQVGNRAMGERSSQLMSVERLKSAAALVLLSPFVPMLFQGEEWGASAPFLYFTDHHDPELGRAVSEGRRREFASFGWRADDVPDPQAPETFLRSKLDWDEREKPPHADLLDWHRSLIALRRLMPAGWPRAVTSDDDAGWLVMERGPWAVVVNLNGPWTAVPLARTVESVALASESVAVVRTSP